MRTVSSVFSWIGGIVTIIWSWIYFFPFFGLGPYIVIPLFVTAFDLGILIWREISLDGGDKTACGVMTLLFCGLIGGILTLCIPDDELSYSSYSYKNKKIKNWRAVSNQYSAKKGNSNMPSIEQVSKLRDLDDMYNQGLISMEEYAKRAEIIRGKTYESANSSSTTNVIQESEHLSKDETNLNEQKPDEEENKPLNESEIISLLREYKKLLDESIITQEEYDNKKKQLLK